MQMDELPGRQQMNDVGSDCTPSLAERLGEVCIERMNECGYGPSYPKTEPCGDVDQCEVCAAAVAVRERDALRAAIGDPEELRYRAVKLEEANWLFAPQRLRRIADAVDAIDALEVEEEFDPHHTEPWVTALEAVPVPERPEPEFCPTCEVSRPWDGDPEVPESIGCPDSWHTPPSAPEEPNDG